MEILHNRPDTSSFTPLAEHQSQTPQSFYSGPPILHHLSENCKIVISETDLNGSVALTGLRPRSTEASGSNGTSTEVNSATDGTSTNDLVVDAVDVWVTSERLLLYSASTSGGVAIRYPSILLHAIQRLQLPNPSQSNDNTTVQGVYMQLASDSHGTADGDGDDDMEESSIPLTIVPQRQEPVGQQQMPNEPAGEHTANNEDDNKPTQTPAEALFSALSACSNLHPDPALQGEEGDDEEDTGNQLQDFEGSVLFQNGLIAPGSNNGGLPPAMPGSGGWITAENVHEYFDEEGNWKGDEEQSGEDLGPGAGTVRPREGDEAEGNENGEDETKWRRTD